MKASRMRAMPRVPFGQIAAKTARPIRIDMAARPSAPKNVAIAGFISRKPKRTIRMETTTAITENTARLRAQVARPDTGSDWYGAENLRAIVDKSAVLERAGRGRPAAHGRPRRCGKFKGLWCCQ